MREISVTEVKAMMDGGAPVHLVDVREPEEVALCAIEGAEEIPMLALFMGQKKPSPPAGATLVVFCHHGQRSFEAARFLEMQGLADVCSMAGGIDAWAVEVDGSMKRYG